MFKFIDLFSGIGGFRIAFEQHDAKCVMSSEIDPHARETYFLNFNEYPEGDITDIQSKSIPDFDILCAGFPCQPFSLAGLRKGFDDTRGTLFFEVLRIINDKQPKAFILENVAGITNHDNGRTLSIIEDSLKNAGYTYQWKLINAKNYGIPQNRNRWYCIGFRNDLNISFENTDNKSESNFKFPEPQNLDFTFFDVIDHNNNDPYYKISDIAKSNIQKHIDDFKEKKRFNQKNKIILANEVRPSRCQFRNDGLSPCLTAKMGTGGNNVPIIVNYNRKLTEKECLAIMGFPKDFNIREKHHQSYKQIGNSVVVPIIADLAKEIIRVLKLTN